MAVRRYGDVNPTPKPRLTELEDVDLTPPQDGQVLLYRNVSRRWVPTFIAAGGGEVLPPGTAIDQGLLWTGSNWSPQYLYLGGGLSTATALRDVHIVGGATNNDVLTWDDAFPGWTNQPTKIGGLPVVLSTGLADNDALIHVAGQWVNQPAGETVPPGDTYTQTLFWDNYRYTPGKWVPFRFQLNTLYPPVGPPSVQTISDVKTTVTVNDGDVLTWNTTDAAWENRPPTSGLPNGTANGQFLMWTTNALSPPDQFRNVLLQLERVPYPSGAGPTYVDMISDVVVEAPANLQILQYSTTDNKWHNVNPPGQIIPAGTALNQGLLWNGSSWAAGGLYLNYHLADVGVSGPSVNQVLTWNGTVWVNQDPPGGALPFARIVPTSGPGVHSLLFSESGTSYEPFAANDSILIGLNRTRAMGDRTICIGNGNTMGPGPDTVVIGNGAGPNADFSGLPSFAQCAGAVIIGRNAGNSFAQGNHVVIIGQEAGQPDGGDAPVAPGAIAIGYQSGKTMDEDAVAIGNHAGQRIGASAVALGPNAGCRVKTDSSRFIQYQHTICLGANSNANAFDVGLGVSSLPNAWQWDDGATNIQGAWNVNMFFHGGSPDSDLTVRMPLYRAGSDVEAITLNYPPLTAVGRVVTLTLSSGTTIAPSGAGFGGLNPINWGGATRMSLPNSWSIGLPSHIVVPYKGFYQMECTVYFDNNTAARSVGVAYRLNNGDHHLLAVTGLPAVQSVQVLNVTKLLELDTSDYFEITCYNSGVDAVTIAASDTVMSLRLVGALPS